MGPLQVILNPNSAGGRGRRIRPRLEKALAGAGIEYTLSETRARGHGKELAAEVRESAPERLLIVGGDGTIHEVVNGLLHGREAEAAKLPALAVLPMGTGNDFFRMMRAPRGVAGVMQVLREGVERSFDVGRADWEGGGEYFVNLVGVGVDVAVLRARESYTLFSGLIQYLVAFGAVLRSYRPVPVKVQLHLDGAPSREVEGPALLAAVTVGPSIGGGFMVAPAASPGDGLLDFFFARSMGLGRLARYLPGILRGIPLEGNEVVQTHLTRARFLPADGTPLSFELDGEWNATSTPYLDIRVLPNCLRILELPAEGR